MSTNGIAVSINITDNTILSAVADFFRRLAPANNDDDEFILRDENDSDDEDDDDTLRPLDIRLLNEVTTVMVARQAVWAYAERTCAVCHDTIGDEEIVRALRCRHIFHHACIERSLATSAHCPTCRRHARL